jgi:hypothetical protein
MSNQLKQLYTTINIVSNFTNLIVCKKKEEDLRLEIDLSR